MISFTRGERHVDALHRKQLIYMQRSGDSRQWK